jgi:uncharacterized protein (TIGR02466 family)
MARRRKSSLLPVRLAAKGCEGYARSSLASQAPTTDRARGTGLELRLHQCMSKPQIFPLFSVPLYVNDVGDFEKPDLKRLEYSSALATGSSFNFRSSIDKNVLDRPEFSHLHDIVMKEVELYAREVFRVNRGIEFYVTNSWVNIYSRGDAAGPHIHHNSLISGVLYLNVPEASADLVFHRDVLTLIPFPPALDLDMDSFNIYNCKSWGHKPKTNEICLFPSVVSHSVEFNHSDEERSCLSFNVFVRGNIGSLHKLSLK